MAALILAFVVLGHPAYGSAQTQSASPASSSPEGMAAAAGLFLAGGATAFVAHEGGHLFFDLLFEADPGIGKVEFHGIPFFAITHRSGLAPREEFTISSAGFWVQEATNEWLLSKRPRLKDERAPFAKGMFAFNVIASGVYAGAAFARTGPAERDTRGMADSLGIDERWIGAIVLAPAVLDTWRYYQPDAKWVAWVSRAVKVGSVLLVLK